MSYRDKSIALVAALAVFRVLYIMYAPLDLSPDEAHYWEWSRRLDLSYYSKGPLVAWVIALFTGIFGDTELGVRFGAVAFSAAASLVMYAVGRDLFGSPKVGFYSVVLAGFTPLLAVGSILMTTDVLLIFFWVSAVWCAHRVTAEGGTFRPMGGKWWYAVGVLVGVGFLGKYTMVLFYPCVALFLFFSMRDRFWLARPQPYIAGLISLVLAAPVLAWNYRNDFVTIRHTMGQARAASPGFSFENTVEFLGSQAGLITPFIFIGAVWGVTRALARGFRRDDAGLLLAFFASAPLFLFFLLKSFHGKVQGNWAVAAYVTALPAAAWAVTDALSRMMSVPGRGLLRLVATLAVVVAVTASAAAYFPWTLEWMGVEKVLDGPPYNRVTGWEDLGRKVTEAREELGTDPFIMSDTYQIASLLAFYVDGNPVTYNINTGSRRMNQYDLWPGPEKEAGRDALYVKGGVAGNEKFVKDAFERCDKRVVDLYMGERYLKKFTIFACTGFSGFEGSEPEPGKF